MDKQMAKRAMSDDPDGDVQIIKVVKVQKIAETKETITETAKVMKPEEHMHMRTKGDICTKTANEPIPPLAAPLSSVAAPFTTTVSTSATLGTSTNDTASNRSTDQISGRLSTEDKKQAALAMVQEMKKQSLRISTPKDERSLERFLGAALLYWFTFRDIFGTDGKTRPDEEEFSEFIVYLPSLIEANDPEPNFLGQFAYVKNMVNSLKQYLWDKRICMFSPNFENRISFIVQTMLTEGILSTKKFGGSAPYICGRSDIYRVVRSLFVNSLRDGTSSWDFTIQTALALVLQSATAAGASDILVAKGYRPGTWDFERCYNPLRWRDVVIRHLPEEGLFSFDMAVTIKYHEVREDDLDSDQYAYFKTLHVGHPYSNILDPVKLTIVHGLRTGAIKATSLQHLLEQLAQSQTQRVHWETPANPVFSSVSQNALTIATPMTTEAYRIAIRNSMMSEGLATLEQPTANDIQRGAIREASLIPSASKVEEFTKTARISAGYDVKDGRYFGHPDIDIWAERLAVGSRPSDVDELRYIQDRIPERYWSLIWKRNTLEKTKRELIRRSEDVKIVQEHTARSHAYTTLLRSVESVDNRDARCKSELESDAGAFMERFSTINTYRSEECSPSGVPDHVEESKISGNSRNAPSRFLLHCEVSGCLRHADCTLNQLLEHIETAHPDVFACITAENNRISKKAAEMTLEAGTEVTSIDVYEDEVEIFEFDFQF